MCKISPMDMQSLPRKRSQGLADATHPAKQQWTEEACYHVMNRGHNRERIFGDDDDRRHFL